MDSSQPADGPALPLSNDIVDQFVEELYHSTSTLAQSSASAIAFSSGVGVQWLAVDDRCTCSR